MSLLIPSPAAPRNLFQTPLFFRRFGIYMNDYFFLIYNVLEFQYVQISTLRLRAEVVRRIPSSQSQVDPWGMRALSYLTVL